MKLHIASDLHLDGNRKQLPELPGGDVLVIAGDLCEVHNLYNEQLQRWCQWQLQKYNHVVAVLGNHEHYGGKLQQSKQELQGLLPHNCVVLENQTLILDGVRFLGCTLWTDMGGQNPVTIWDCKQWMNDYRYITWHNGAHYRKLEPQDTILLHKTSKHWLEQQLSDQSMPTVVVTHHAPSQLSVHPRYQGDQLNGAYYTQLDYTIMDYQPQLWIHGHMHDPSDYYIGLTRVVSNPRGYPGERANWQVVEVEV